MESYDSETAGDRNDLDGVSRKRLEQVGRSDRIRDWRRGLHSDRAMEAAAAAETALAWRHSAAGVAQAEKRNQVQTGEISGA